MLLFYIHKEKHLLRDINGREESVEPKQLSNKTPEQIIIWISTQTIKFLKNRALAYKDVN